MVTLPSFLTGKSKKVAPQETTYEAVLHHSRPENTPAVMTSENGTKLPDRIYLMGELNVLYVVIIMNFTRRIEKKTLSFEQDKTSIIGRNRVVYGR